MLCFLSSLQVASTLRTVSPCATLTPACWVEPPDLTWFQAVSICVSVWVLPNTDAEIKFSFSSSFGGDSRKQLFGKGE